MKIAVTGASGYIGRHVIKRLEELGFNPLAILSPNNKNSHNLKKYQHIDILNSSTDELIKLFKEYDTVIHLAWRAGFNHHESYHLSDAHKHLSFVNTLIQANVKNINIAGTMHEIGFHVGEIDDKTACFPITPYGIAKDFLRNASLYETQKNNIDLKWLRMYYIYGDDENNNSIFSKILQSSKDGKKEFPLNSGEMLYDFIEVRELANQIVQASIQTRYSGIINCCSGNPKSLKSMVEDFIKTNNIEIRPVYGIYPSRPYDSPAIWGSSRIIKNIISSSTI